MDENKIVPTPEELELERTAQQQAKEEEVRVSVISEYGFDEEIDTDKIDKAVEREMDSRKKLSEAIGQKIKYRNLANRPKNTPPTKPEVKDDGKVEPLNLKDIRALNDVHDDDVDRLVNYAKFMNITVAEAKKLPEMVSFLRTSEEHRLTASATNTGGGKRGTSKVSDEDLLSKASSGDLPEDDANIARLMEAKTPKKQA